MGVRRNLCEGSALLECESRRKDLFYGTGFGVRDRAGSAKIHATYSGKIATRTQSIIIAAIMDSPEYSLGSRYLILARVGIGSVEGNVRF